MRRKVMSHESVSAFCLEMALLVHAGISAEDGLYLLAEDAADAKEEKMLTEMAQVLGEAEPLSQAVRRAGVFPAYVGDMIETGEQAGRLEESLRSLSAYYDRQMQLNNEIRSALLYPVVLMLLMLVIILVLSLGTDISGTVQNDYNLLELIPYLIVLVGGIVGINVFIVLLLGILSGSIIVVAEGAVAATDLLGNMGTGAAGMFETTMVAVLVSAICALIRENGGFVALLNGIKRLFRSRKGGQLGMGLLVGAMDIATANNTVAIVMANPIAHEMAETYNVSRRKTASILDTFSCVFQGVIPYGAQMLVAISACTELGFQVSAFQIMPFLFYPFFLLISSLVFIFFVPDDRGYVPDHAAYHSSSS